MARLRDPALIGLLAVTALLLGVSWWRQEGCQGADSVEYLERAHAIAHGRPVVDSRAIRSLGYTGLLIPLFSLADLLALRDLAPVVHAAKLLQVVLSLALVAATARLGARLSGRWTGLGAAAIVGFNPVLLQWGIEPVSGVAAALCVVLAVDRLVDSDARASSAIAGALLGLALLMAFQSILVLLPIVALETILARHPRWRWLATLCAGIVVALLLQCLFDWFRHGSFGVSLVRYVLENTASPVALTVDWLGRELDWRYLRELSHRIYNAAYEAGDSTREYQQSIAKNAALVQRSRPAGWYFANLSQCLVWPAAAAVALGGVRAALRFPRRYLTLGVVVLANVLVMSSKGSKDFRLWLPFLPLVAVFGGLGIDLLARSRRLGALAAVVLVSAIAVMGAARGLSTNARMLSGYSRAIALVEQVSAASGRSRVAAAYHFAVFLRTSDRVELIKLRHDLDFWSSYGPEERARDLKAIAGLDWFIVHQPVLTQHPELFEAVNRDYSIHAVFHDRAAYEGLGPVYVLRKRTGDPDEATFFDFEEGLGPDHPALRDACGPRFVETDEESPGELTLLRFDYRPLPGDGHGWITYEWSGGPLDGPDYKIIDLIADRKTGLWNNHYPAYGLRRTPGWKSRCMLREGYVVVAEVDPFRVGGPSRYLGEEDREGGSFVASLWLDVASTDGQRMRAFEVPSGRAFDELALDRTGARRARKDGMVLAGRFDLPVHPGSRAARMPRSTK